MATNRLAGGRTLDFTNATGGALAIGGLAIVGTLAAIVLNANDGSGTLANGKDGVVAITGVYTVAKLATDVVAQGAKLYWDAGNSRLTTTAAGNTYAGVAYAAAGNGAATVALLLNGLPD